MGLACSTHERNELQNFSDNMNGSDCLEDIGVGGTILIQLILKEFKGIEYLDVDWIHLVHEKN
jgi:hypothetical protein